MHFKEFRCYLFVDMEVVINCFFQNYVSVPYITTELQQHPLKRNPRGTLGQDIFIQYPPQGGPLQASCQVKPTGRHKYSENLMGHGERVSSVCFLKNTTRAYKDTPAKCHLL